MREEYDVRGATVTSSNVPKPPHNPLHREKIGYRHFWMALSGFAALIFLTAWGSSKLCVFSRYDLLFRVLACVVAACIYLRVIAKRSVIWLVHFYQNHASDEVRLLCVYEPSCSEYMILAVEKYGAVRGVIRGIRRIYRCHPPNGGMDYP
ncbi:MAG: membrane protein insertion efficiency factor YidD [Clostridiales bacterium]|nr:membrane protein insertion efficiency factor YidD [Clostridiales bacterium]